MTQARTNNKYLLSINEASAYFNIGRDKMYQIVRSNSDAPTVVIGKVTKINKPMFEQFLDKCTEEGRKL